MAKADSIAVPGNKPVKVWKKGKELTEKTRIRAVYMLKGMLFKGDGKLERGAMKKVAKEFECHPRAISRLWKQTKENEAKGLTGSPAVKSNRSKRGALPKFNEVNFPTVFKAIPFEDRRSMRKVAIALGVSPTTVRNLKKKNLIQQLQCTNSRRPTAENAPPL